VRSGVVAVVVGDQAGVDQGVAQVLGAGDQVVVVEAPLAVGDYLDAGEWRRRPARWRQGRAQQHCPGDLVVHAVAPVPVGQDIAALDLAWQSDLHDTSS